MSAPDIAGLLDTSKDLDRLRKEQEEVLLEINKMHKKLQSSEFSYLDIEFNDHRHFSLCDCTCLIFSLPRFILCYTMRLKLVYLCS